MRDSASTSSRGVRRRFRGDHDVGGDCVALAADAALRVPAPSYRDVLILRDVLGFDIPLLWL